MAEISRENRRVTPRQLQDAMMRGPYNYVDYGDGTSRSVTDLSPTARILGEGAESITIDFKDDGTVDIVIASSPKA